MLFVRAGFLDVTRLKYPKGRVNVTALFRVIFSSETLEIKMLNEATDTEATKQVIKIADSCCLRSRSKLGEMAWHDVLTI